jgi:hypothetical protein
MSRSCSLAFSAALFATASVASAQSEPDKPCDGEIIHAIEVVPSRPPFSGSAAKWRAAARAVGLHHATTRPEVAKAFLALHLGMACTERRRVESERILRAQQFIGDARITTRHDSAGNLIVRVETTDEIPALIGGRIHGFGFPQALSLGNANIGGMGLLAQAMFERKEGYRTGYGGRLISSTFSGHPYRFTVDGERANLGHRFVTRVEHPLFTDLQRIAWHASYQSDDEFRGITRLADDDLALEVRQQRYEGSVIARAFGDQTVTLLGFAGSRVHLVPVDSGVLVTRQGLQPDTGSVLRNRYSPFTVTRAGGIAGMRHITFTTVVGFDALFAPQDVASGYVIGVLAAKSLPSFGEQDEFLSSAAYLGAADEHAMLGVAVEVEGRRTDANEWDSVIGSGRGAFYLKGGRRFHLMLSDEFSGGSKSRLPLQLSFGDPRGGVRGFGRSNLSGAVRNVVRAEARRNLEDAVAHADLGLAVFTDVGHLWAGDAPYGVTTTRQSVGMSILAAYPSRAKRVYRLDVAFPLTKPGDRGGRLEFRVTSEDRTERFWQEPDDVLRARTGAAPSALFGWQKP